DRGIPSSYPTLSPPCPAPAPYTTLFRSKCSHSREETSWPDFFSSAPTRLATIEVQEPQVAPALVQAVTEAASVQPCSRTAWRMRSEEHTSELQSRFDLVCRLLLEKRRGC